MRNQISKIIEQYLYERTRHLNSEIHYLRIYAKFTVVQKYTTKPFPAPTKAWNAVRSLNSPHSPIVSHHQPAPMAHLSNPSQLISLITGL